MKRIRETFKRLLVSFLCFSMFIGYLPMPVYAADIEEEATCEPEVVTESVSESVCESPVETVNEVPCEVDPAEVISEEVVAEEAPVETVNEAIEEAPVETTNEAIEVAPVETVNEASEEIPSEIKEEVSEAAPAETEETTTENAGTNEVPAQEISEKIEEVLEVVKFIGTVTGEEVAEATAPEGKTDQEYIDDLKNKYGENIMDKIYNAIDNGTPEAVCDLLKYVNNSNNVISYDGELKNESGEVLSGYAYQVGDKIYMVSVDSAEGKVSIAPVIADKEDDILLDDIYPEDKLEEIKTQYGKDIATEPVYGDEPVIINVTTPKDGEVKNVNDIYFAGNRDEGFIPLFHYYAIKDGVIYSEEKENFYIDGNVFCCVGEDGSVFIPFVREEATPDKPILMASPLSLDELQELVYFGDDTIAMLKKAGYSWIDSYEVIGYSVKVIGNTYYKTSDGYDLLGVKVPDTPKPDEPINSNPVVPVKSISSTTFENVIMNASTSNSKESVIKGVDGLSTAICSSKSGTTFDLKMSPADERTTANQEFLAKKLLGANATILKTVNIYPRRNLSISENGSLCTLTLSGFEKNQAVNVYAVVYNAVDGTYVIDGKLNTNGAANFEGFKLRPASTITICK